jgi:pilus assembly protein CpaF
VNSGVNLGASPAERPAIGVLEGADSTLVDDVAARQRQALAGTGLDEKARQALRERLKPEKSGIALRELDEATAETRMKVEVLAREVVSELQRRGLAGQGPVIPDEQAATLVRRLMDGQFGAGPLEPLFHAPDVEDIVINSVPVSPSEVAVQVWTYRQSGKHREPIAITAEEVQEIVNRNAGTQGRALNTTTPVLNAQMRNGARVNAVLDPVCDPGICATIRIHRLVARSFDDLVRLGTLTPAAASWLWLCVQAGLAMVVGGGTSSGKTNFLNALARVMPPNLRVVCIEDTRELDLAVEDRVYLVTVQRQPHEAADGARAVTQRHLVANALRMRPDRLVLGEVRDAAAWDAVKACNTGHPGTLLTVHAEDAEGVLTRLGQLCGEAAETANIPEKTLKEVIASAFQVVVFLERRRQPDGSVCRHVTEIVEVNGFVTDGVVNQRPIFRVKDGRLQWTGNWPHERIKRRLYEAGFSDDDIQGALGGHGEWWRRGED